MISYIGFVEPEHKAALKDKLEEAWKKWARTKSYHSLLQVDKKLD